MDRAEFAARFAAAAAAAQEIARTVVLEPLPEPLLFRVRLNQSYEGRAPLRYPEDSGLERAVALHRCDAATVVAELWRDGHVPQWVNVAVVSETGDATVVEVVCCARFTADDAMLYRAPTGPPPFNVGGPWMWFDRDVPFSIHRRAECWDAADLRRLAAVAGAVRSLHVMTGAFDADLPDLPNLEILEHHAGTLGSLAAFARFPKLRTLQLHVAVPSRFPGRVAFDALECLTITDLPSDSWGQEALAGTAPVLTTLDLHAPGVLRLDGAVPRSLRELRLTAAELAGPAELPDELDRLELHLARGTDRDVERLLRGVTRLRSLDLSGTPVTDAIIPVLDRLDLATLDLRRTAVSDAALARFREERPGVRLHPYVPPPGSTPPPSPYDNVVISIDGEL